MEKGIDKKDIHPTAFEIIDKIRNYAGRFPENQIKFPHHFGMYILLELDELIQNYEAMKEGEMLRIADLEKQLERNNGRK